MVEVLRKTDRYKIECKYCHSLLAYDEYDEIGRNELQEEYDKQVELLKAKHRYGVCFPFVSKETHIICPICNNKVTTSYIVKHAGYCDRLKYGEKIER